MGNDTVKDFIGIFSLSIFALSWYVAQLFL